MNTFIDYNSYPITMDNDNYAGALACPVCGFAGGMHQEEIICHRRPVEDGDGTIVTVRNTELRETHATSEELFGRRDAVFIRFSCEGCSIDKPLPVALKIQQHKGSTLMSWVKEKI